MNPYQTLGVSSTSSITEIKAAYRQLVKKFHPDTCSGGDKKKILAINAAWEILRDQEQRNVFDNSQTRNTDRQNEAQTRAARSARASAAVQAAQKKTTADENELFKWLNTIYNPIDNLLGQIITPFLGQMQALSADPYDNLLMENFCDYLEKSQKKVQKIKTLYTSSSTPIPIKEFGLDLYHCFSEVEDALNELQRYTMGYVDNYLHDGKEMLDEAKQKRISLKEARKRLTIS